MGKWGSGIFGDPGWKRHFPNRNANGVENIQGENKDFPPGEVGKSYVACEVVLRERKMILCNSGVTSGPSWGVSLMNFYRFVCFLSFVLFLSSFDVEKIRDLNNKIKLTLVIWFSLKLLVIFCFSSSLFKIIILRLIYFEAYIYIYIGEGRIIPMLWLAQAHRSSSLIHIPL